MATNNPSDSINVLLIGNNPIDLSDIYKKLKSVKSRQYITDIRFEIRGLFKKITRNNPACILVDDNLEKKYLSKLMRKLSTSNRTKDIPIAILKNANKDNLISGAQEFLLKDKATGESISQSILNSIRIKKMQVGLGDYYVKNKKCFFVF